MKTHGINRTSELNTDKHLLQQLLMLQLELEKFQKSRGDRDITDKVKLIIWSIDQLFESLIDSDE